ncbi:MAG: rhomboid family intramembrane serine protease [Elusimicrobiota bacterium]
MDGEWVDKLERRFGFLAAPGLPTFISGMTVIVGVLQLVKPEFGGVLTLDPFALASGQVWRCVSFLFVPPPAGPLWLVLWILMLYSILQALEQAWGEFKFTVFLLIGVLATAAGALATRAEFGDSFVILGAFLAFARLMPDREVLVMFVLPVKMRWLAGLAALWLALEFVTNGWTLRVELLTGLLPYILFFGEGHRREAALAWRRWRQDRP